MKEETKDNIAFIRGSLWGAVLGDVIGAYLEFNNLIDDEKINSAFKIKGGGMHKLEPGQPTDDSELAYSVGKGLIRGKGKLNMNCIAEEMGNWFLSKPIDVGSTIRKSIPKACNMKEHQGYLCRKAAKESSSASQSNGTLMAITPMSIWCCRLSPKDLLAAVREYTILVHSHEVVSLVNGFYSLALCFLLRNPELEKRNIEAFRFAKEEIKPAVQASKEGKEFIEWIGLIEKSTEDEAILDKELPAHKKAGWVRVAFTLAFHELLKTTTFQASIRGILRRKGDTDTNACIAGGLLGAYYGYEGLNMPKQIETIEKWRPKKVSRPHWLVPGMVLENLAMKLQEYGPAELKVVGGEDQYKK